jgi:Uma2 family endonuclease
MWRSASDLSSIPAAIAIFVPQGESGMTVNAPARPISGNMDVDEFMAFLETRPKGEHWELIEGIAVMMAPPSIVHQRIASNFCNLLNKAFEARHLDLYAYSNVGLRTPGVRNFQPEPDVAVLRGAASYDLYSEHFQLAAEILSPSNTRGEIDLKLRRYCEAPENLYAFVIDSRAILVEIRGKRRGWQPAILKNPDDPIEMPEFGLRCAVLDLYRGTPLDPV